MFFLRHSRSGSKFRGNDRHEHRVKRTSPLHFRVRRLYSLEPRCLSNFETVYDEAFQFLSSDLLFKLRNYFLYLQPHFSNGAVGALAVWQRRSHQPIMLPFKRRVRGFARRGWDFSGALRLSAVPLALSVSWPIKQNATPIVSTKWLNLLGRTTAVPSRKRLYSLPRSTVRRFRFKTS